MTLFINVCINNVMNILFLFLLITLFLIILQKNPVYSIFTFILIAFWIFLFLLAVNSEFFALLILIIYTGVITVLFLFVVIMYNLRDVQLYSYNLFINPFFGIFIFKMYWFNKIFKTGYIDVLHSNIWKLENNTLWSLDVVQFTDLYNNHYFLFFMCGLLLFIAMLGSVVITYPFFKYQH